MGIPICQRHGGVCFYEVGVPVCLLCLGSVGVVGEGVVGACATNDVIVLPNQVVVVDREVDRLPGIRRGTRWECIGEGLK